MRAVVQRVDGAAVRVAGQVVGSIGGPGLCVLVAATHTDTPQTAAKCADKVYDLRVFDRSRITPQAADCTPPGGRPSAVSAADLGLPVLVISQFTLYGQTTRGRRPTWELAAPGHVAAPLVERFVEQLRKRGATVATGLFGADMRVSLTNDGPVTLIVEVD